jgi:hypothetical protein
VIYFFDRNMGHMVPIALSLLGLKVEIHDAHFRQKTPDDVWLATAGTKKWTVISHDPRFPRNEASRQAIAQHCVGCFVIGASQGNKWQKVRLLARVWDEIDRISHNEPRPYIFRIYLTGEIRRVYPPLLTKSWVAP